MSGQAPEQLRQTQVESVGSDAFVSRRLNTTWLATFTIIGLLIVGLLAAVLFVMLGGGSADDAVGDGRGGTDSHTFTASGSLQLIGDLADYGEGCVGDGGYSDLGGGSQVVIRDARGEIVSVGALQAGIVPKKFEGFGSGGSPIACAWSFEVPDIPSGSKAYSVEVSHRGQVAFTEETATSISLSLG